jgi:ABC-type Mn2+/Zn2+ transport system permease subunit
MIPGKRSRTMIELLQYGFMQRAIVSATLIGAVCALIGVYIILRGLSFIGAGIAHASFGGVAIGFLLNVNPVYSAFAFCVATAWAIGFTSERGNVKEETAVGVFFASTMAFGAFLVGVMKIYNVDLFSYIFGNILIISDADLYLTIALAVLIVSILLLFQKEFLFLTFDREMAQVVGLPVKKLNLLMLFLIAFTVVISIKAVGIVLVSALLVTPAATAFQLTRDFKKMQILSVFFGVFACWLGMLISALVDVPSGATIVLVATALFFIALFSSPLRRQRKQLHKELLKKKSG